MKLPFVLAGGALQFVNALFGLKSDRFLYSQSLPGE